MRKKFLIHKLGATYIVVDITGVGAQAQAVQTIQFTSWGKMLEDYFLKLGATTDALNKAKGEIDKSGTVSLLI